MREYFLNSHNWEKGAIMNNFGKTFRKIRKSKEYSIEDLASIEVSKSAISRFEREEIDLSFSKVVILLDKLHVSVEEFVTLASPKKVIDESEKAFSQMILSNDKNNLEKQILFLNQELESNYNKFQYLNLIIYETHFQKINHKKISSQKVSFLVNYLFSCDFWTYYELTLFGNMIEDIPLETCLVISKELVKKSPLIKQNRQYFETLINVLINIAFLCINSNKIQETRTIIDILTKFNLDETFLLERTILLYLDGILGFCDKDTSGKKNINKAIKIFKLSDSPNFSNLLTSHFESMT